MALELVANEDLMIEFTNTTPGALVASGDLGLGVGITTTKSSFCKAEAKAVCTTSITLTFSIPAVPLVSLPCPFTLPGFDVLAGAGSLLATAIFSKAEGMAVLRVNDVGVCAGLWTNSVSGATSTCACTLKIIDAGQTTSKAD